MIKTVLIAACASFAFTGLAAAQATQPAQPTAPAAGTTQPATPSTSPATTAPAPAGVRVVDPATLRLTFYTVTSADMLASRLMDLDVHNLKNEEIGEIEDLIIDEGKVIRGIVLEVGGFLGIGERRTVVSPGSIIVTREGAGNLKAVVNTTKEELGKAPEFKFEGNFRRK